MGKIFIQQLKIPAIIGVYEHEQNNLQEIVIDLEIVADTQKAAQEDNLEFTIDYSKLYEQIINFVQQSRFKLLETLAERLAENIQQNFPILQLRLKITKKPADLPRAEGFGIIIER